MAPLVVPLSVPAFVGEQAKATFYGNIPLVGADGGAAGASAVGMLSDRSASRLGRRRPFIFFGTLADLGFIAAIGFSAGLAGMSGYWLLFAMYLLLQVSSNAAQGAQQGLIPDLVPPDQRGRFPPSRRSLKFHCRLSWCLLPSAS